MSLTEDQNTATYQIKSYLPEKIVVNEETLTRSFIISPNQLIKNWPPQNTETLTENDLRQLLTLKPHVILIGTGEKSIILPAKKLACLLENNFHVECMNTMAACRTYTVLSAEGRHVVAGIIL
ncbi:MAG: hypothetical protein COY58_07100 [Gammaproteobacteria bacterium CG_4_10_14_0_8_um_filter_38_16]|nr:MAG: hypothetical protein COY58_07100 [Gammaproteobacteria bacterium CG_4_10_14_0_8_um_filter_38_16]PJA04032.1 MAG: hypothetical protein COX72_02205 [Gammaproteobacteria bacterium CG_4_10_14_0_2_um_filter_38_22]PJB10491.1 MAG: hypothetical protein CO120_04650 [Gammaproteobacteria bacterium CG_4_9_14_3_um_filter_38_9]